MMKKELLIITTLAILIAGCNSDDENKPETFKPAPAIVYQVAGTLPHDVNAFTEGLSVHEGRLFESTGSPEELPQTRSVLGYIDTLTGKIDIRSELDRSIYFGEGTVFLNNKLYQLTYLNQKGFVYDAASFQKIDSFTYASKEGWGLTTDGTLLIMSDGTSTLTYLDPQTFKPVRQLNITESDMPVTMLNELEWINGFIYANVYTTSIIVKIDPASGKIVGRLYLDGLLNSAKQANPSSLELNGIAYDSSRRLVYVTGKMWPYVFAIRFDK